VLPHEDRVLSARYAVRQRYGTPAQAEAALSALKTRQLERQLADSLPHLLPEDRTRFAEMLRGEQ